MQRSRIEKCPACKGEYIRRVYWQRYCSKRCRNWAYYQAHKATKEKEWKPKKKRQHHFIGLCGTCGREVHGTRDDKKYCSAACKQVHYRLRKSGALVYDVPLVGAKK